MLTFIHEGVLTCWCGVIVAPMLALLQKIISCGLLLASLGVGGWFMGHGGSLVAAIGASLAFLVFSLGAYAAALAIEPELQFFAQRLFD